MSLAYRRDIDGLRAVAILAVVLFHAGVPWVRGGFSGVDIFFVISGYLITSNILKDLRQGTFTVAGFYERRLRRIFPSLVVMCGLTLLAGWFVLLPQPFRQFGSSLASAMLFNANFYFAGKTGYFDAPAADQPLLHVWSLGVEEQFYMVFPWLVLSVLWLARRYGALGHESREQRVMAGVFAGVIIVSFVMAQLAVQGVIGDRTTAFYIMPLRMWEFMLGAILVLLPTRVARVPQDLLALAGAGLLATGIIGLTAQSPFPGAAALLPCLGTAFIIQAGRDGRQTLVARGLGLRPVVFIGMISYSFYLWHWPLLVMPQLWHVTPLTPVMRGGLIIAALGIAVISWKFVEMPVRKRQVLHTRKAVFTASLTAILLAVGASVAIKVSKGVPQRFAPLVLELDRARDSRNPRWKECLRHKDMPVNGIVVPGCVYGAEGVSASWALWGDSIADSLIAPLGDVAMSHRQAVQFFGMFGCPPVPGFAVNGKVHATRCEEFNQAAMAQILNTKSLTTVVLATRYEAHVLAPPDGQRVDVAGETSPLTTEWQDMRLADFRAHLQASITQLILAGKRVIVTYPVPEHKVDVPTMLATLAMKGIPPETFSRPEAEFGVRTGPIDRALDTLTDGAGQLLRVKPAEVLCHNGMCTAMADGKALYNDPIHLNLNGGALVAKQFEGYFPLIR